MIVIENVSEGDRYNYFELLRIYYPYYEENENLTLKFQKRDDFLDLLVEFPNIKLEESFLLSSEEPMRDRVSRYLVNNLPNIHRVSSPWGILTGVRPIKFLQKLKTIYPEEELFEILTTKYLVSHTMSKVMIDIADLESRLTRDLVKSNYSLYINIPFCPSRCAYCSYPTIIKKDRALIHSYIQLLCRELEFVLHATGKQPDHIYIGGGTPTSIGTKELAYLLETIENSYAGGEYTLEAGRPDTIIAEIVSMISNYSVNRLSINPQTMNDSTLKIIGRNHTAKDIEEAYDLVRGRNKWDINMDLILGLPGEGSNEFTQTLNRIYEMNPENITIHTLSLKNGSKWFERRSISVEEGEDLGEYAYQKNRGHGYHPYYMYRQKRILGNGANIGYCKANKESFYNMIMMEELQNVVGIGMASTTKLYDQQGNKIKFSNFRNLRDYQEKFNEIISTKEKNFERSIL